MCGVFVVKKFEFEVTVDAVMSFLSERGCLEWELATQKALNAELQRKLSELLEGVVADA